VLIFAPAAMTAQSRFCTFAKPSANGRYWREAEVWVKRSNVADRQSPDGHQALALRPSLPRRKPLRRPSQVSRPRSRPSQGRHPRRRRQEPRAGPQKPASRRHGHRPCPIASRRLDWGPASRVADPRPRDLAAGLIRDQSPFP